MRLLGAFVVHELRTRLRSVRFWAFALLYVGLCVTPAVVLYLARGNARQFLGPVSYLSRVLLGQPLLTALLAAALSIDAFNRERHEGSFAVLGLAPVSNAGFLLRRWLSVLSVTLPLTLIPPAIAAALAVLDGAARIDAGTFLWPWLLHVLPLALAASALALGLGTITGHTLLAAVTGLLLFGAGLGLVNDVLARFGHRLGGAGEWLGLEGFGWGMGIIRLGVAGHGWLLAATEAPWDVGGAWQHFAARGATAIGFAALVLGASVGYLRRTRRDVRPWRIRDDHPLRTFLRSLNRARAGALPDPGLMARDWALVAAGVAGFALSLGWAVARDGHYLRRATERYETEISGAPEPTPATVHPRSWSVSGRITGSGRIDVEVDAELSNVGTEPVSRLAFALNPGLALAAASDESGSIEVERRWDRVTLRLDPPLAPGGVRRLRFELSGTPGEDDFALPPGESFVERFEQRSRAEHANQLTDLSRSRTARAISARRVALEAADLFPVPRYTPWSLTPKSKTYGVPGRLVPPETVLPWTELRLDLETPPGLFLADSCGHSTAEMPRLRGACRQALARFRVRGGSLVPFDTGVGGPRLAVLPVHAEAAELHLPSLAEAVKLAARVWPGLDPLAGAVFLEWPPPFDPDPFHEMWIPWGGNYESIESLGRLVLIPESMLVGRRELTAGSVAAAAAASELAGRRPLADEQRVFFERFFGWIAASRLGVPGQDQSVLFGPPEGPAVEDLKQPMLGARRWDFQIWNRKLPAVFRYIERRAGADAFLAGVENFLAGREGTSGTVAELFERLAAHTDEPLQPIYDDFVAGAALPLLSLADVSFRRGARGWEATGSLVNRGTGRTRCPVVLDNGVAPVVVELTVDGGASVAFSLASVHLPRSVTLDPRHTCYRYQPKPLSGTIVQVDYREES